MKAKCDRCINNTKDKQIIVGLFSNERYLVHCRQCDWLYISKKQLFSSTLKNEYVLKITELCEYINNILDNSLTSVKDILEKKVMFDENIIVYLLSEGHLVLNDMGVHDKNGRYTDNLILVDFSVGYKEVSKKMYHEQRVEMLEKAKINPKDISRFNIPWINIG